jgi:hypothetical protein
VIALYDGLPADLDSLSLDNAHVNADDDSLIASKIYTYGNNWMS